VSYDAAFSGYVSRVRHFSHNARAYVAYYFLLSVHLGIYGVIFNLYILRLGFREDLLGLMLSIVFISTGLAAIPAAFLCDRLGRKNTLLFSVLVTFSALLPLYTIATADWLLALSAIYGIGTAFYIVAGSPFLMENSTADERIHLFSVNSAMSRAAYIVGCMAGGLMPGVLTWAGIDPAGPGVYRYTLFLSLALIAMSVVPILFMKEAGKQPRPVRRLAVLGSAITSQKVQKLIAVNGLIGIGAGMIVPFFNVYFHNLLMATTGQIGLIFSAGELVMIVGLIIIPIIVERSGKVKTIAFTELASIPFLVALAFTTNIYVAAVAYVMRMTLMNMAGPAINSFNMELVEDGQRATVSSLTSMAWYMCMSISAYLSGIMMAGSSYALPFMVTCGAYLCAALLYYLFFSRVEKEAGTAPLPRIVIPAKR
jgi:MFS family permease